MASLYYRTLRSGTVSPVWWAKYSAGARVIRQSTGTTDKRAAQRFLDSRVGRAAEGLPILPRADRVRYEEAAEDLRQHYATTGSRGTVEAGWRLTHLGAFFAGRRLVSLGPQDATAYAAQRQGPGASNATINRELAVLGRMLRLAAENNKLHRVPVLRKLKESAPRAGFFEPAQYEAVRRRLPADLQAACAIAYTYGWRMRSEVLTLRLSQLDLKAGTLRLEPGDDEERRRAARVPHPGAGAAPGCSGGPRGGPGPAARARPHHSVPIPHFTGTATRRPGTWGAVRGEPRSEFRKA
jgi:integrase